MRFLPARRIVWVIFLVQLFVFAFPFLSEAHINGSVHAAGTTIRVDPTGMPPTSSTATWAFDPVVTEVGKNSERARQLLWWVYSHQGIHTTPVLAQLWAISRNIVYVFIIFVIIALGLGLILSSRKGTVSQIFSGISNPVAGVNIPSIFMKVGAILVYVTFSYVLIVGMIQIGDIIMRFFIENVGGKDLFNVIFAGAGNKDDNYLSFVGYSDINPMNQEMVNTSLFLIRFTSMTYYIMAILLILRTIILWFLLIVSPFLALLMPFIFIRNIGWIWIGVFFQWLFYGPLMALFLASLTRIWIFGIPYAFDFTRVNQTSGQVYKTSINILYGGPAQTITPGNSANYVDTYAEYVIALVMLWTTMILPWLLLRIFRDYCCAGIAAAGAVLNGIFDRLRQYPIPPPPIGPISSPAGTTGLVIGLPFRQKIKEEVKTVQETHIENIREITREATHEITRKMDISVSSLADVSRFEMDKMKRENVNSQLKKIAEPQKAASSIDRQKYSTINSELKNRAATGDLLAKSILTAGSDKNSMIANISLGAGRPMVSTARATGAYAPSISTFAPTTTQPVSTAVAQTSVISNISQKTGISESKVNDVLKLIPTMGTPTAKEVSKISERANLSEDKVKEVIAANQKTSQDLALEAKKASVKSAVPTVPVPIAGKTVQSQVSVEDYEEVKKMWLNHYREAPVPATDIITTRQDWITDETRKMTNISNLLSSSDPKMKQKGFEEVSEILPFLLLGGFSDVETIAYLKAKTEAAKQIETELEIKEKAKEEAKKEAVEEETLVEVKAAKKEEKQKEQVLSRSKDLPINQEGKGDTDTKSGNGPLSSSQNDKDKTSSV